MSPEPGVGDLLGQPLLLMGGSPGSVDHQQGDIGLAEQPPGPQHRVELDIVLDPWCAA